MHLYNYIYDYTVDPSLYLNLPIPPKPVLILPLSHLTSSKRCFILQYEHNKYIVLMFDAST